MVSRGGRCFYRLEESGCGARRQRSCWSTSRGMECKDKTPAQAQEWERWLVFLCEKLDEQPDWIAWKKHEFGTGEENEG
jgi:hypothetical protein